jgi:hypothetical protein
MTLNKTWEECLRMWKWVSDGRRTRCTCISDLKERWAEIHGYSDVRLNCFFCDLIPENEATDGETCLACPGKQVDPDFDCMTPEYSFVSKPKAFYAKLVELNKKRLAN